MASPDLPLGEMQRWMLKVVVHVEGAIEQALNAPDAAAIVAPGSLETVILPSPTLDAAERIGIYRGMYPLRMREALESDYPTLLHFLGDEGFDALVRDYVTAFPSRSYTLNRLGDHFPEFIAAARGLPRPAFCADLARLELAIAQVFDADESPALDAEAVAAMGEAVADLRLSPVAAFRLLGFRYPVNAYLQSCREEGHTHPRTALKGTWVAVFRRQYSVRRLDLTREQHTLLAALAAGETLGAAVLKTLRSSRRRLAPEEFFQWFRQWVSEGMFRQAA